MSRRESDDRAAHLHSDVEPRDIKGLEHDLGCVLSVFWCVQRRLCLKNTQKQISSHAELLNIPFPRGEEVTLRLSPGGSSGPQVRPSGT